MQMQLLHLLDTSQNIFAVIKIYLRVLVFYIWQTASRMEMTWNTQDGSFLLHLNKTTISTTFWTTISVFLMSNMPVSPIWIHRKICIFLLPSFLASHLFIFLLTLLVTWEIWVTGIFFHQARCWSLQHQISSKFMERTAKKEFCVAQCWDLTLKFHPGLH